MRLPTFITFTGVDDATDPAGMVALARDYPGRIEWGVLFSPSRQGLQPRYPAISFIEWLVREFRLRYAAHLCGAAARAVITTGASPHDGLLAMFHRAQVNTVDLGVQPRSIRAWAERVCLESVILQCRGAFPIDSAVEWLSDTSGGRGLEPTHWPRPLPARQCGYAGGLRPENVADAARVMGVMAARADATYWIDMETGVRDENDRFSLTKCRAVCEAVYGAPQ